MATSASIAIRLATAADAATVAAFGERTFRDTFGPDNRPDDMDKYCAATYALERQRRELAEPGRLTVLAEAHGELAAYAQLLEGAAPACVAGPAPIELLRFYVDRPWHGRGIAAALMAEAIARAAARGGRTLHLAVWERNARAIAFYRKQGFRAVGTRPFLLGDDRQVDHVMVRPIG